MDREVELKEETLIAVGGPLGAIIDYKTSQHYTSKLILSHHLEGSVW